MRRYMRNMDWILILATFLLMGTGLVLIASATCTDTMANGYNRYVIRQSMFMGITLTVAILTLRFDYNALDQIARNLYIFTIILLLAVMFVGRSTLGAQRWIQIGPLAFQPSEFSKAFIIITLASFLKEKEYRLNDLKDYLQPCLVFAIPFFLVLKQPDLGTALVFAAIAFSMFWVCGFKLKWIAGIGTILLVSLPLLWQVLHEYQRNRIRVFMNPELDPFGAGYHVIQSKIAIGSGLLFGKGWQSGTQSQLNFLPENHTDFIFAVAGEEFGFIGVAFILFLFMVLIWRSLNIALHADTLFGKLLAAGITGMFIFHVLVNVGMTGGIMPVTGVPLPFLSYGVSSLSTNIMLVALLLNINLRNKRLQF